MAVSRLTPPFRWPASPKSPARPVHGVLSHPTIRVHSRVQIMLRFLGSSHRFCDGHSRRDFLQIGAFGAGLTLADMLRLNTARAAAAKKQSSKSRKSAIMIY